MRIIASLCGGLVQTTAVQKDWMRATVQVGTRSHARQHEDAGVLSRRDHMKVARHEMRWKRGIG
jgi:hypothetical protein